MSAAMKLRTRLAVAFLLLAVVPLAGLTLLSYATSSRAVRMAAEVEAGALAEEIGERMQEAARELSERIGRMRTRPRETLTPFEKARQEALAAAEQAESRPILLSVLTGTARGEGEIPFAIDPGGELLAPGPAERRQLETLAVGRRAQGARGSETALDWMVVWRRDPVSGLVVGVARPVAESLAEIRRTAVRNLGYGMGLVLLALFGILPLSDRMTRDLADLTAGAERLGRGDLEARVPVRSRDEIGRLAETFNAMGRQLRVHQEKLLEQARLKKELEMCRRIQEELLPREHLRVAFAEAAGVSIPAREVGGDFFNYFTLSEGEAALLVGDVSGKGVAAALLMANLQATLRARLPIEKDLARLATLLDREIAASTPEAYLTLFIAVVEANPCGLRYVNAGHNPPYALRCDGRLEVLRSTGRPLGLLPGGGYEEKRLALAVGDCLFLFTDGLVEAENAEGESFGCERLEAVLARERGRGLAELMACADEAVRTFRGSMEAADDATMVVLRFGALTSSAPAP